MLSKKILEERRATSLQIVVVVIPQRLEIVTILQDLEARLLEATVTMLLS
jgi:hypothetical protein